MKTRTTVRALGLVAALAVAVPATALAEPLGPPYVAAGGGGLCSPGTRTWMMRCDADGSADQSGAVAVSAFAETAGDGTLPGSGEAIGLADIYTEHPRDSGAAFLTYTTHLHVDTASVERSAATLGRGSAEVVVRIYVVAEDCSCFGYGSATLASTLSGPAAVRDVDLAIPVVLSGDGEEIPAGTSFIQMFFDASADVSFDTGRGRADAAFTVTHIDVS